MEGAGEDPYLGSLIAKARIEGFQGDLNSNKNIIACAKHFAGYGFAESGRDYNTVDVSESTLQNIILPPFKAAADAGLQMGDGGGIQWLGRGQAGQCLARGR